MASRSCTLPSPRVIRPLRSKMLTPATSREAIVNAMDIPPCRYYDYRTPEVPGCVDWLFPAPAEKNYLNPSPGYVVDALCFRSGRSQMLDQRQLGSGMQLSEVYLIHEGSDQEDAAPRAAKQVLRGQRVGKRLRVQSFALVSDGNHQRRAGVFKAGGDLFGGGGFVAVQNGVYRGLARPHRHMEAFVLVQAGLGCQFLRRRLNLRDAFHRRIQPKIQPSCLRFAHRPRLRPFRNAPGSIVSAAFSGLKAVSRLEKIVSSGSALLQLLEPFAGRVAAQLTARLKNLSSLHFVLRHSVAMH